MKAEERRNKILEYLQKQRGPVSATSLASTFGVSRQIIVGDVALLRASGINIAATPRGYVLQESEPQGLMRQIACQHNNEQMEDELCICVDYGCSVLDVIVEHPVYGQLTAGLQLNSRYDITQFVQKVQQEDARPLSDLTDGIHLHTLRCPSQEAYELTCRKLKEAGYLLEE